MVTAVALGLSNSTGAPGCSLGRAKLSLKSLDLT
jgi:hypothetical protein